MNSFANVCTHVHVKHCICEQGFSAPVRICLKKRKAGVENAQTGMNLFLICF